MFAPPTPAEQVSPPPKVGVNLCGCGCGTPVVRRYRPGHDARHKSNLVATLAHPHPMVAYRAAELLDELGWSGFAPPEVLRAIPYRDSRGRVKPTLDRVQVWQVDHLGGHHAHRGCRTLTQRARSQGGCNRISHLASDRYVTLIPNTPEIAARLPYSWDLCTDCCTPNTRDEQVQHLAYGQRAATFEPKNTRLVLVHSTQRLPDPTDTRPWAAPCPSTRVA